MTQTTASGGGGSGLFASRKSGGKSPPTRILGQSASVAQCSKWRLYSPLIRHFLGCYPTRRFMLVRRLVEAGSPPTTKMQSLGTIHPLARRADLTETIRAALSSILVGRSRIALLTHLGN
jgi:hypothetical protein